MTQPEFFIVPVVHAWSSISENTVPLKPLSGGPTHFLPVFTSREDAVAFAERFNYSADAITPMEVLTK